MNIDNAGRIAGGGRVVGGRAEEPITGEVYKAIIEALDNMEIWGNFPEANMSQEHLQRFVNKLGTYIDFQSGKDFEVAVAEGVQRMEAAERMEAAQAQVLSAEPRRAADVLTVTTPEAGGGADSTLLTAAAGGTPGTVAPSVLAPATPGTAGAAGTGVPPLTYTAAGAGGVETLSPSPVGAAGAAGLLKPSPAGGAGLLTPSSSNKDRSHLVRTEDTVLGLARTRHNLNIQEALENTKGMPVAHQFFQALALCYIGNKDGYTPEEIAQIKIEQAETTARNMGEIRQLLRQKHIDYVYTTARLAELTGGLIVNLDQPIGETERKLEEMVRLYKEWAAEVRGATAKEQFEAEKKEMLAVQHRTHGHGFSGLSQAFSQINRDEYAQEHLVDTKTIPGEKGPVTVYEPKLSGSVPVEENLRRCIAACVENGITSANAVESWINSYAEKKYPTIYNHPPFKMDLKKTIQEAVGRGILSPYKAVYASGNTVKEVLDAEFDAMRYNMPREDQTSPTKVMEYLKVYRGILDVQATRPGDMESRNIGERALNDYIKYLINEKQVGPLLWYDEDTTNINQILEEELLAYQINKPEDAGNDYDTVDAFEAYLINDRDIMKVKGIRTGDNVAKPITMLELKAFLNQQVKYNVLRTEPRKGLITFEKLEKFWEDYLMVEKEGAEDDVAVRNDFSVRAKARGAKKEDLDRLFEKVDARPRKAKPGVKPVVKPAAGLAGAGVGPVIPHAAVPTTTPVPTKPVLVPVTDMAKGLKADWDAYVKKKGEDSQYDPKVKRKFVSKQLAKGVSQDALDNFFKTVDTKGKGKEKVKGKEREGK